MTANNNSHQQSHSVADRLERKLNKILAAEKQNLKNENILRLEKNGDISYETVRSYRVPVGCEASHSPSELEPPADAGVPVNRAAFHSSPAQNPAISNSLPNKLPQTPALQENGNLIGNPAASSAAATALHAESQSPTASELVSNDAPSAAPDQPPPELPISCHEPRNAGNKTGSDEPDPVEDLLRRALTVAKVRRGRPPALDDQAKGQLIALLAVGMSIRQAAAVLGVSHTTVQKALKADPSLDDDINAARFQAQLQPLACVIREARRSWKAATWLLKYLDSKIASHEETPDERRQRQHREAEEFFARSPAPNVKNRKLLG
jgi:hypothetical protein